MSQFVLKRHQRDNDIGMHIS